MLGSSNSLAKLFNEFITLLPGDVMYNNTYQYIIAIYT